MEAIQTIQEGMSMKDAWGIVNQLIEAFNKYQGVIADAVVDGQIDYNAIRNRPLVNGVELVGERTLPELGITTDTELVERADQLTERMALVELRSDSLDSRAKVLEDYRTLDVDRIQVLEDTRKSDMASARTAALAAVEERMTLAEARAGKVEEVAEAFSERMSKAESNITSLEAKKADVANAPTLAQWNTLRSDMAAQVTAAQNARTDAIAAVADLPNNASIQQMVSKINELVTRSNRLSAAACGSEEMKQCLDPTQQLLLESKS